ncbi:MAG: hypothetical protein FWH52_05215 [Synergistaceae bacterium]|nr:hypothetical protein [Synergistaceae bacterium]
MHITLDGEPTEVAALIETLIDAVQKRQSEINQEDRPLPYIDDPDCPF